jgi:hypothetical protein
MTLTQVTVARRFEPDRCANCFTPLPDDYAHRPWLFCSLLCRETASTLRYWRTTTRNGKFQSDPSVRLAIGIRIAHILAGGYNMEARRIPLAVRALVKERDKVCVKCGAPGEEIDHIDGDSCDPGNLQLLCKTCHHAKTAERMVPASPDQAALVLALQIHRVLPGEPVQLCDDESGWVAAERKLRGERLARLRPATKNEVASIEMLNIPVPRASAVDLDDDDDDDDRDENYYEGFGENSHYLKE